MILTLGYCNREAKSGNGGGCCMLLIFIKVQAEKRKYLHAE
jgi:hypothetical protein